MFGYAQVLIEFSRVFEKRFSALAERRKYLLLIFENIYGLDSKILFTNSLSSKKFKDMSLNGVTRCSPFLLWNNLLCVLSVPQSRRDVFSMFIATLKHFCNIKGQNEIHEVFIQFLEQG